MSNDDPTIAITDAVAAWMPKQDWGRSDMDFNRVLIPEVEFTELSGRVNVQIASESTESERSSRGGTLDEATIAFALRGECKSTDLKRSNELFSLAYTIGRKILATTFAGCRPLNVKTRLLYDVDTLKKHSQLFTIRTVQFRVGRRI